MSSTILTDITAQNNIHNSCELCCALTIGECQNTDDQEEGDDQDEPHPDIIVRISIISADRMKNSH